MLGANAALTAAKIVSPFVWGAATAVLPKAMSAGERFFQGAHYTQKVVDQMKLPDFHGFPAVADKFAARFGEVTFKVGRDGAMYEHLKMPGGYLGREGIFHYIKNHLSGAINHRMFEPY